MMAGERLSRYKENIVRTFTVETKITGTIMTGFNILVPTVVGYAMAIDYLGLDGIDPASLTLILAAGFGSPFIANLRNIHNLARHEERYDLSAEGRRGIRGMTKAIVGASINFAAMNTIPRMGYNTESLEWATLAATTGIALMTLAASRHDIFSKPIEKTDSPLPS